MDGAGIPAMMDEGLLFIGPFRIFPALIHNPFWLYKSIGIFLLPVPCVTAHVTQSSCGLPAKQHFCLFCRGEADRDISRPAANDLKGDMNPSGTFKYGDQLKDAMSPACSQIDYLHALVRSAERKCCCVASGNVHDVNIIPDTCTIWLIIISAKNR